MVSCICCPIRAIGQIYKKIIVN